MAQGEGREKLAYEAEKLMARLAECRDAFEALERAARDCSEAIKALLSGSAEPEDVAARLSAFLDALSDFEHELSHLSASASTILARLFGQKG